MVTNHDIVPLRAMSLKGLPLRRPMGLMAGARNRGLGASPDGDAARVCEGSNSEQAALRSWGEASELD